MGRSRRTGTRRDRRRTGRGPRMLVSLALALAATGSGPATPATAAPAAGGWAGAPGGAARGTPPPDTASAWPPARIAAAPQQAGCQLCHSDLEFLREQSGSMAEARSLQVSGPAFRSSAHGELACVECHPGLRTFPHAEETPEPATCASCHEDADTAWAASAHAEPEEDDVPGPGARLEGVVGLENTARCSDCHGVHATRPVDRLEEEPGIRGMNARCVDCHATVRIPEGTPHADSVACWSCHRPHDVRHVDTPEAAVAPRLQAQTCGTCHDSLATAWTDDVHAAAVMDTARETDAPEPPACVACHGGHEMVTPASHESADTVMVERCGACHEDYHQSYLGTYHGKATAVGSRVAATCHDCHSSHQVYPASEAASWVSEQKRTETCGECHGHVRPGFVAYESHPDPTDREKNPVLFYSFWFMNSLLVGVLGVFGLHTLLWWVRLYLDKRKGIVHEIGGDHE